METQHRGCGEEWEQHTRCRPGRVPAVEPELAAGLCDQVQLCGSMNLALVPACSPSWLAFCRYVAQRCAKSLSAAFSLLKNLSSCLLPCPELTGRRGRLLWKPWVCPKREGPWHAGSAAQAPVRCQQHGCGSQLLVPL